jgi:type I restriction enzyme S subunit
MATELEPSPAPAEQPDSDLPEGWVRTKLPEIADIIMGQSPPGSTYNDRGEGLPFFQGKADFGTRHPRVRVWCSAPQKIAERGDVLISVRAPVGPTNVADRQCAIGRGLAAVRPLGSVPTEFVLHTLRQCEAELAEQGTGTTFTAISRAHLDAVEVDLPPRAEQERIVAAVEALLATVDRSRERIAKLPAILKRFRQAVLAAACSGRLTADWREAHQVSSDQPSALDESPELPEGWEWREAGDYYCDAGYGTSVKCDREAADGFPVLRIPNIASGALDLTDLKYAHVPERQLASLFLQEGDIVVCRTNGSLDLIGKAAVVPSLPQPFSFASYLIRLRLDPEQLLPEYLHICLSSPLGRDHIEKRARTTAGQFNLNLGILREFMAPVPPLAEQDEIVRRVEALFGLAGAIERRVAAAQGRADKLTQAILAKAFRGELVPTEAELARREGRGYEPAAALLARIQAERGQAGGQTSRRRGGRPRGAPRHAAAQLTLPQ